MSACSAALLTDSLLYVTVYIDVTICWQVWTGTSEEIAIPTSKGCHNARLRGQQFRLLGSLCAVVQVTDVSEKLL
jgi:hypothetical protein